MTLLIYMYSRFWWYCWLKKPSTLHILFSALMLKNKFLATAQYYKAVGNALVGRAGQFRSFLWFWLCILVFAFVLANPVTSMSWFFGEFFLGSVLPFLEECDKSLINTVVFVKVQHIQVTIYLNYGYAFFVKSFWFLCTCFSKLIVCWAFILESLLEFVYWFGLWLSTFAEIQCVVSGMSYFYTVCSNFYVTHLHTIQYFGIFFYMLFWVCIGCFLMLNPTNKTGFLMAQYYIRQNPLAFFGFIWFSIAFFGLKSGFYVTPILDFLDGGFLYLNFSLLPSQPNGLAICFCHGWDFIFEHVQKHDFAFLEFGSNNEISSGQLGKARGAEVGVGVGVEAHPGQSIYAMDLEITAGDPEESQPRPSKSPFHGLAVEINDAMANGADFNTGNSTASGFYPEVLFIEEFGLKFFGLTKLENVPQSPSDAPAIVNYPMGFGNYGPHERVDHLLQFRLQAVAFFLNEVELHNGLQKDLLQWVQKTPELWYWDIKKMILSKTFGGSVGGPFCLAKSMIAIPRLKNNCHQLFLDLNHMDNFLKNLWNIGEDLPVPLEKYRKLKAALALNVRNGFAIPFEDVDYWRLQTATSFHEVKRANLEVCFHFEEYFPLNGSQLEVIAMFKRFHRIPSTDWLSSWKQVDNSDGGASEFLEMNRHLGDRHLGGWGKLFQKLPENLQNSILGLTDLRVNLKKYYWQLFVQKDANPLFDHYLSLQTTDSKLWFARDLLRCYWQLGVLTQQEVALDAIRVDSLLTKYPYYLLRQKNIMESFDSTEDFRWVNEKLWTLDDFLRHLVSLPFFMEPSKINLFRELLDPYPLVCTESTLNLSQKNHLLLYETRCAITGYLKNDSISIQMKQSFSLNFVLLKLFGFYDFCPLPPITSRNIHYYLFTIRWLIQGLILYHSNKNGVKLPETSPIVPEAENGSLLQSQSNTASAVASHSHPVFNHIRESILKSLDLSHLPVNHDSWCS